MTIRLHMTSESLVQAGRSRAWLLYCLLGGCLLGAMANPASVFAASRFYTVIGPDGRMQVIERTEELEHPKTSAVNQPSASSAKPAVTAVASEPVQTPTSTVKPVLPSAAVANLGSRDKTIGAPAQPVTPPSVEGILKAAKSESGSAVGTSIKPNQSSSGIDSSASPSAASSSVPPGQSHSALISLNGEQYVDSEFLQEQEFNLEERKRFYAVPGADGKVQMVERQSGVNLRRLLPSATRTPEEPISFSSNYHTISAQEVASLIGQQCFSPKSLRKPKRLQDDKELRIWPLSPMGDELPFNVIGMESGSHFFKLTSYALTDKHPEFYWPLVIFLNKQGCVLEGATGFYQKATPASMLEHGALIGHVRVPDETAFLVLTPLEKAADLPNTLLSPRGQLSLKPRD